MVDAEVVVWAWALGLSEIHHATLLPNFVIRISLRYIPVTMSDAITFENDSLRFTVYPQLGGKVSSIVDQSDGYELLVPPATDLPESSQYGSRYLEGWRGGLDECFPSISAGIYPLIPYLGIEVPDHGEIWPLPTTAVPTKNGITTVWHGLRFGYRLTRKLFLQENALVAEYSLINLSPFVFRFVWGPMAHLSVRNEVTFDSGDPSFERFANRQDITTHSISFNPITQPLKAVYASRKRLLCFEYESSSNMSAYWSIMREAGGSEGTLAVAPISGRSFELAESIQDESAAILDPMGRLDWRFRLRVDSIVYVIGHGIWQEIPGNDGKTSHR